MTCTCLSVRVWSKSDLVGNAQELCGALGGTALCAVVFVEAIVGEHHHLHEEGPLVRQRRPVQLNASDLPERFMFRASSRHKTHGETSKATLSMPQIVYIFF